MAKRSVVTVLTDEGLKILQQKSAPVAFSVLGDGTVCLDAETLELIQDLKQFVIDNHGLGMSAIQLGVAKRIFVMRKKSGELLTIINPTNVDEKTIGVTSTESCFSIPLPPNVAVSVIRGGDVSFECDTEAGEHIKMKLSGRDSIVFQHEFDHLLGKLMIDEHRFNGWRTV